MMVGNEQATMHNNPDKVGALLDKIREYLALQSASTDGGWAKVTEGDMNTLTELFQEIIDLRFGGDIPYGRPVEFWTVDRTECESLGYRPVKYSHHAESSDELLDIMKTAEMNMSIASDKFQTLWRLFNLQRKKENLKTRDMKE